MSIVYPIEPWIQLPAANLCLDERTDAQRRERFQDSLGLRSLIPHHDTPISATSAVEEGRWTPTGSSGIYLVREELVDASAIEKVRHCWMGSLDPDARRFKPVVAAEREMTDRLAREVRRGGVDPTGVVALYRDEDHRLEKLVEAKRGATPLSTLVSPSGARTQVWCLSREESGFVSAVLEECGGGIVGDVAMYRAIVKLRDDPTMDSSIRPVVRFYHQRDFGVSFAPTARLYRGTLDMNRAMAKLHPVYEVDEYSVGSMDQRAAFVERVRNDGVTHRSIGLFVRGSGTGFLIRTPDETVRLIEHENTPEAAGRFDAEWVEKGILRRLFDVPVEIARIETDLTRLPHHLVASDAGFGFVVNPPPKRDVSALVQSDWRLPVGSLIVRPAVARGLLLCPLRPASHMLQP